MRSMMLIVNVVAGVMLCSCAVQQETSPAALADAGSAEQCAAQMISLGESVEPFRARFNANADRPRFVTILSSTCGPCVAGAVAVNESIVRGYADAGVDVHVVWIDVLRSDNAQTAQRASVIFDDPRVTQYHDPYQQLGKAFAHDLVSLGPAWDIYLFYPAKARWDDEVPLPADWMHQLGGGVAEKSRYKSGSELAKGLHDAMKSLGFAGADGPPSDEQLTTARDTAAARIGAAACAASESDANAAAEPADSGGGGRCAQCQQSGRIGQCSISGWRYVAATREREADGSLSRQFMMAGAESGPVDTESIDQMDTRVEYVIEGMRCPDCLLAVVGKVFQVRGVRRVEVDYDHKRLIVYVMDDPAAKLDMLPTHLGLAGYEVTPLDE